MFLLRMIGLVLLILMQLKVHAEVLHGLLVAVSDGDTITVLDDITLKAITCNPHVTKKS